MADDTTPTPLAEELTPGVPRAPPPDLPLPGDPPMSIFDRFRLTGKRLFITGGSRGLGRAMALAIADAGADVVLVGRDAPSLDQAAAEIRALGRQAHTIQADVGVPEQCEDAC